MQVLDVDAFWERHRGGTGAVIAVQAFHDDDDGWEMAVFGSLETAESLAKKKGPDWRCVFMPYLVDEPDFGNTGLQ